MRVIRTLMGGLLLLALASAQTKQEPGTTGALPAAQIAADAIRAAAKSDGAFLTAGNLNATFDEAKISSLIQYPTEQVVVVEVKGADIRAAFERSVYLYPQPNRSFLQISGFTVEFSESGAPLNRIRSITTDSGALDNAKTYTIAMPLSLGRGGMGYFKQWDKTKIVRTLPDTMEQILRDVRPGSSSPRWLARP